VLLLTVVVGAALAQGGQAAAAAGIDWEHCGPRLQCADVRVPLNWADPGGRQIRLRVDRHLAGDPGRRIGTLFAAPGGPGESGAGLVANAGAELDAIGEGRFDIVGFDPRGTNGSTRIRCFRNHQALVRFWRGTGIPGTVAESKAFRRKTAELARRCGEVSGDLLRHVSTADVAHDLDYLRRLLSLRQISFIGFSYGTYLGETYANLFPGRVRAMVLDGVVDPVPWAKGAEARLASGVPSSDEVFERFESLCQVAGPARCALAVRGSVKAGIAALFARLRKGPIPAPNAEPPGSLTYGDLLLALFEPLRNPAEWPRLAEELDAAEGGDGSALEMRARPMRSPRGWSAVTTSAAIQCADGPAHRSSDEWPQVVGRLESLSKLQGAVQGWWEWAPCASWPVRDPGRYAGPWDAKTEIPILVIGTRHDPNTSYASARRTAHLLGNAVLLTHDGYGHLSFQDPSACVEKAETAYLVHLSPPPPGTVCKADRRPFAEAAPAAPARAAASDGNIPDGPGGVGHLAPLVIQGLRSPVPFEGSDSKTHLTYVVTIQNAGPVPVKIDKVSVLDAVSGKVISAVAGKTLEGRLGLLSSPVDPLKNAVLDPSQAGAYWVDATLPTGAPIPKELEHRVTATPIGKSFYAGKDTIMAAPLAVSRAKPIRLRPPLEGPGWVDLTGCCTGVPNHRHALFSAAGRLFASQEFAIDFMRFGPENRLFTGDSGVASDYFGYGAPVLAVADATVVAVSDHLQDQVPLDPKPVPATEADGNFIMLNLGGGHYANYAHLAPGSITVKVGERVTAGEQMALVGNTGQTGVPHLHFHVMDRPLLAEANGLPYEFRSFRVEGVAGLDSIDRGTSAGTKTKVKLVGRGRHRDELPLELTVMDFPPR
jgi:pimeloyl-ACP methyl ester carboxylesterase